MELGIVEAPRYFRFERSAAKPPSESSIPLRPSRSEIVARLEAKKKPVPGEKNELAEAAKELWSSLGGTEEGWTMWYGRRANDLARLATLRWEDANEPLAAFELGDLNGNLECRVPEGQGDILELLGVVVRVLPRGVASPTKIGREIQGQAGRAVPHFEHG